MKITNIDRIIKEDFPQEDHKLIEKLAYPVNRSFEQIGLALKNGLDFENNFNAQTKTLEVTVDADGVPTQSTSYRSTLKGLTGGIWCIRAENLTNPSVYPSGQPFLSFTENASQVFIQHITGLQADQKYRIKIIALV